MDKETLEPNEVETLARFIGRRVKDLRTAQTPKRWSQERLAREVGMSRETIMRLEEGKRPPEWYTIQRICEALHVPVFSLLGYPEGGPRTTSGVPGAERSGLFSALLVATG